MCVCARARARVCVGGEAVAGQRPAAAVRRVALCAQCKHFSEKVASCLFEQMLLGIKHCHDNLVVHRDVKPDNFLFASAEGDAVVKLTDFGLAMTVTEPDEIITDAVGSAFFIAPEVFKRAYTRQCDSWSLGVNLFLLLSGTVPFGVKATKADDVYRSIQRDELTFTSPQWKRTSPLARELVGGLLDKNPAKRYTVDQARPAALRLRAFVCVCVCACACAGVLVLITCVRAGA